jgi:hypothetical protein
MTIEAKYAASTRGSSPHRNASDVFGGVSGEVCTDRNRWVFGMAKVMKPQTYQQVYIWKNLSL